MEQKPKRKGTPHHPFRKVGLIIEVGLIIAASVILSVLILVIILNFTTSSDNDRIQIAPVDAANVPHAQQLMHNPEIETDAPAGNFISLTMLSAESNHYLCLEVLPIALIEVNLAALHIRVNGEPIPAYAMPEGAPINCLLLDASFEQGWYIFELDILDTSTYQPVALYRWGTEIR
jgi:hypothetical protein